MTVLLTDRLQIGGPSGLSFGSVNLLEQLTGLGEIRTSFTSVLQDTIKDPDEQPMKSYTE